MKERGLIFSAPMAAANMADRKTMTRRMRGLEHLNKNPDLWQGCITKIETPRRTFYRIPGHPVFSCPFGKVGDLIWMRETWGRLQDSDGAGFLYRADFPEEKAFALLKWRPSIHMPRIACRFVAQLVSIKLERLLDITPEDVKKEGIVCISKDGLTSKWGVCDIDGTPGGMGWEWEMFNVDPKAAFVQLFSQIHGEEIEMLNPWVWVLEYKRLQHKTTWKIYDERYLVDEYSAHCYEVCQSEQEAKNAIKEWSGAIAVLAHSYRVGNGENSYFLEYKSKPVQL